MPYVQECDKMLLVKILPGKATQRPWSAPPPLRQQIDMTDFGGCDSYNSNGGVRVLFRKEQLLPCYVIHYKGAPGVRNATRFMPTMKTPRKVSPTHARYIVIDI